MDEQTVRVWLKERQDRAETLAQQQAAAFQLQFDILRAELQVTRDDPERWIFAITVRGSTNGLITDWERFVESVKNRFGPFKYEDLHGVLSKLLQLDTIEEYRCEFEKLMNRVTDIPETLLISFYISGLKLHLQCELYLSKPTTLCDAFSLARITEARLDDQETSVSVTTTKAVKSSGGQRQSKSRYEVPSTSVSTTKPTLLTTPAQTTVNVNPKPLAIKWISLAEGLFFNCDNKWVRGHKCTGKFLLLMADDRDDAEPETETDTVESGDISILNSLIGQGRPRSL
ncbi:retrotransposon-related protein [Tanacetum coccineum]